MLRSIILAAVLLAPASWASADANPPAAEVIRLPTAEGPAPAPMSDGKEGLAPRAGCGPTVDGEAATADGKVHGDVAVAAGTGGYRAGGLRLCAPLGHDGEVQVQVTHAEGGGFRRSRR